MELNKFEKKVNTLLVNYYEALTNEIDFLSINTFCSITSVKNNYFKKFKSNNSQYKELNADSFLRNKKLYDLVSVFIADEIKLPKYRNDFIRSLQDYSDDILIFLNTDIKKVFDLKKILTHLLDGKFIYWEEVTKNIESNINKRTNKFRNVDLNYNLLVFKKKKFLALNQKRFIQLCSNNNYTLDYNKNYTGNSLQNQFMGLKKIILECIKDNYPLSIMRFGDGELFFVNALPYGSAKPGVRALKKIDYKNKINFFDCRRSIYKPDIITTEINSMMYGGLYVCLLLEIFYKFFPNFHKSKIQIEWKYNRFFFHILVLVSKLFRLIFLRILFFPVLILVRKKLKIKPEKFPILKPFKFNFETIYALVSTRLIFKMFPDKEIMIVAQKEKIDAIKILMTYEPYRSYLGIKEFNSYVGVPKIGAADDEIKILADIKDNVNLYKPKIIIIGIGMAKLYIIPRIKEFTNAIVIDVGVGVDALAGVVSQDRPFFSDWINFKSNKINYSDMDLMSDKNNPERDSNKYKKILLNN